MMPAKAICFGVKRDFDMKKDLLQTEWRSLTQNSSKTAGKGPANPHFFV